MTDRTRALASPGLAVLSAFAHGNQRGGVPIAIAALESLVVLPTERATLYFRFLQGVLREGVFATVEAHMEQHKIPYRIPFAKKAYEEGQAEGRELGRQEGHQEGRQEGLEALRQTLLTLVAARLGGVESELRTRIAACREMPTLQRWLEAVATAADDDAVRAALAQVA